MKIEDAKSNFFFVLDAKNKKKQKKIKPVQKNLDWFQKFCTGLKNFVLVQKKIVRKIKLNYNIAALEVK